MKPVEYSFLDIHNSTDALKLLGLRLGKVVSETVSELRDRWDDPRAYEIEGCLESSSQELYLLGVKPLISSN